MMYMTSFRRVVWCRAHPLIILTLLALVFSASGFESPSWVEAQGLTQGGQPRVLSAEERAGFEAFWASLPRENVPVPDEGAAVLVVKFTDFRCPACANTHFAYQGIFARHERRSPGRIKVISKDYPLDSRCNPFLAGSGSPGSCEAAAAVHMAAKKGQGAAMEDWLYRNHATLTPEGVRQAAERIAGVTNFDEQYPAAIELVKADAAQGQRLKVQRTPTFFINGVRVEGGLAPEFLDAAISYEMKRASGQGR
jgi:protein-disulfide isomerase